MPYWSYVFTAIISYAVTVLTAPSVESPKPVGIDEIDVNTAEEGSPILAIFGKPWIKSANCVWYGDLRTTKIKSKGGKK